MQKQNMRVVLATEHPQVRYFLGGVIERENRGVIVGEAQDAGKALGMARNLRPDVAVIDCNLPYHLPYNAAAAIVPQWQMGGLDVAQAISEEIPNIRVILLNNLDTGVLTDRRLSPNTSVILSTESVGASVSFGLQNLLHEVLQPNVLVFANAEIREEVTTRQQTTSLTDKMMFFGASGIATGWLLTLTMFLAPIGVPLALAGGVLMLFGLTSRLTNSMRRRLFRRGNH